MRGPHSAAPSMRISHTPSGRSTELVPGTTMDRSIGSAFASMRWAWRVAVLVCALDVVTISVAVAEKATSRAARTATRIEIIGNRSRTRTGPLWRTLSPMNALKIIAIILIVAGILGLVYGKFSYTKASHEVKLGPVELAVKEKETVNVPMWSGIAAIVVGVALLLVPRKT